jgi:predicted ATP-dependent Lon-type protease
VLRETWAEICLRDEGRAVCGNGEFSNHDATLLRLIPLVDAQEDICKVHAGIRGKGRSHVERCSGSRHFASGTKKFHTVACSFGLAGVLHLNIHTPVLVA